MSKRGGSGWRVWSMPAALVLGLLVGSAAHAASNTDYAYDEHNGCEFHGEGHYNTNLPITRAKTNSLFGCASLYYSSLWTWDGSTYVPTLHGWSSSPTDAQNPSYATTDMYGYHQIRAPMSSYSNTIETRP